MMSLILVSKFGCHRKAVDPQGYSQIKRQNAFVLFIMLNTKVISTEILCGTICIYSLNIKETRPKVGLINNGEGLLLDFYPLNRKKE
jgi:hypothetical protein